MWLVWLLLCVWRVACCCFFCFVWVVVHLVRFGLVCCFVVFSCVLLRLVVLCFIAFSFRCVSFSFDVV